MVMRLVNALDKQWSTDWRTIKDGVIKTRGSVYKDLMPNKLYNDLNKSKLNGYSKELIKSSMYKAADAATKGKEYSSAGRETKLVS